MLQDHITLKETQKKGSNGFLLFPLEVQKAKDKAEEKGLKFMLGFQDEARFGRINRPQRCWAPAPLRPQAPEQIVREYTYAYGASFPKQGIHDSLILPDMSTVCMNLFLQELAKRHQDSYILLVIDGASNHRSGDLNLPENIQILPLPAYSPDYNPQENIWDEIREKFFTNVVFHDMDAVEKRLIEALLYLEHHSEVVQSITQWKWIMGTL